MKQVILNIPDNIYLAFINHVKSKFTGVQIKEKKSETKDITGEDTSYETMFLSEKSLAEDWLSDEDDRWDEVL
jgi:methionine-rich copper-binding protein CopC